MKQISLTTILGFISGFGLFILAIVTNTDNYLMFLSFSSFIMVIGGTLASAMVSFSGSYVVRAFKELFSAIKYLNSLLISILVIISFPMLWIIFDSIAFTLLKVQHINSIIKIFLILFS